MDIDNCKPGMTLDEEVTLKGIEHNIINSRKISVKANVEINARVYSNENTDIVSNIGDIENIQLLKTVVPISSLVGEGTNSVNVKETIKVDVADELAEIMRVRTRISGREAKISYNKVLVKADMHLDMMYLTEDGRINNNTTTLPIMGFVDMPNVNENNICDVKCKLKNFIVKPTTGESSSIHAEAEIELVCFVYEEKNIDIIEDLYSTASEVRATKREVKVVSKKQHRRERHVVKEQIQVPEIGSNKIYNIDVRPNITNMNRAGNKVVIQGELGLEFLFGVDKGVSTKNTNIPFECSIDSELAREQIEITKDVEISKENFTIVSDGNIEVDINLDFNLGFSMNRKLEIIEEVELEESKQEPGYSMVIYFVKPGDTLWRVAKKLKSTIEDIRRVNALDGEDGLEQGMQLYIPKYIKRNVEIA